MQTIDNLNIKEIQPLLSPSLCTNKYPITEQAIATVRQARAHASDIIHGQSKRLLVIIGPCSIHDTNAALEYASKLKQYAEHYQNELCIIMRVYFEKPRTTVGWKGLINDPYINKSFDITHGLQTARALLLDINHMGLPTATEFLDTVIPQYICDLIAWAAIGARTTESQIHRELASGLSMPVGFKNGTTGNITIAVDACYAANQAHHFLGVTKEGIAAIVHTSGNKNCHIILRGSNSGPNYDEKTIQEALTSLQKRRLPPRVMVDCSHGNSNKDYTQQFNVLKQLSDRIQAGDQNILGVMLESNLVAGKQSVLDGKPLTYGQSITDGCIGWEETEKALALLSETVKSIQQK